MRDRVDSLFLLCDILTPWSDDQADRELRCKIYSGAMNWPLMVSIASGQVVITTLLYRLVDKGIFELIPDDLKQYLLELHRLNKERNKRIRTQLKSVLEILNTVHVTPALLKGAAFLYSHEDIGSRMMTDIDLLIRKKDAKKAIDGLFSAGYDYGTYEPERYVTEHHFAPLIHSSEPVRVELHTELLSSRKPQVLKSPMVFNQAKTVRDGEHTFRLLSPTDSIHYTMIHSEIHHRGHSSGAVFLKGLHDFAMQTSFYSNDVDWPYILALMKEHSLAGVLRSYLYTAKKLFKVPTPSGLAATHAERMHFQRRLIQVRYKRLMFLANGISIMRDLFSASTIKERFGCSDGFLSLAGGRLKYLQHLYRKYVRGGNRKRFLDDFMGMLR